MALPSGLKQELVIRLVGLVSATTTASKGKGKHVSKASAKSGAKAKAAPKSRRVGASTSARGSSSGGSSDGSDGKGPVILVLGEGLQHLPWEGLPVLQVCYLTAVTEMEGRVCTLACTLHCCIHLPLTPAPYTCPACLHLHLMFVHYHTIPYRARA